MNSNIKEKLLDLTEELKSIKINQEQILKDIVKNKFVNNVKNEYSNTQEQEYYLDAYNIAYADDDISELLKNNPIALTYYQQNEEIFDTLLIFALDIYKSTDNLKIDELENLELNRIKLAKEKIILTTSDFELLYNYSKNQQANFRARLNNSLPFMKNDSKSKSSNAKILYNAKDVKQWFDNNF